MGVLGEGEGRGVGVLGEGEGRGVVDEAEGRCVCECIHTLHALQSPLASTMLWTPMRPM